MVHFFNVLIFQCCILHTVTDTVTPDSFTRLFHQESPKVARTRVHGACVADGDEQAVGGLQEGGAGLMQREEVWLLTLSPAHAP